MKELFIALLATSTLLLSACKFAVIMVEGGEVRSDRSGTCVAGTICLVEVEDTSYVDVFEPIPYEGWYFDSWNKGNKFLCGGSIDIVCSLSFSGYEAEFENLVASSETFYLMPIFKPIQPDSIVVDGRAVIASGMEWLQPVDFVNYSYNQVAEVCPEGVCSGMLPGSEKDLSGYIWASIEDVQLLAKIYRSMGRDISADFERTASEPLIDYLLYAMVHEAPNDEESVYVAMPEILQFPIDRDTGTNIVGVWFWRPTD